MSIKIEPLDKIMKPCKGFMIIVCLRNTSEEHDPSMPQSGWRPSAQTGRNRTPLGNPSGAD